PARIPNSVKGIIRITTFGPESIRLHPQRIDVEKEAMSLVMEGIEGDFDVVVVGRSDSFSAREVSPDSVRVGVPANPDHVEVRGIVPKVQIGGLCTGFPIRRGPLREAGDFA